ncbi:hypothetical protein DL769_008020 [Monosporascus sp. CRB-8-3]|nr:hypothetical protein DL769_008020 [Monosporascus sp. CRB-8-3]
MGLIYRRCSRVIVYLGADLILSSNDSFPPRHRLHELEGGSTYLQLPNGHPLQHTRFNLRELLKRSYFSRVWVIQELILSPRAIIRVGGLDFYADPLLPTDLAAAVPGWQWNSTAAPWVQYTAQRAFPATDIFEVIRLTSTSRASDPRDKVFGVLGLIQDETQRRALQPNYSLSTQHVFIGLLAHCIINQKAIHVFLYAAGLSAPAASPSWVVDWTSYESWQRISAIPESNVLERAADFIVENIPTDGHGLYYLPPKSPPQVPRSESDSEGYTSNWFAKASQRWPWDLNSVVDVDTGQLSLYMTRLCAISSQPILLGKLGTLSIFEVRGSSTSLYLAAREPLEAICRPECDHLFILNSGDSGLICLVLRELDLPRAYKIVAPCQHLFIQSGIGQWFAGQKLLPLKIDSLYAQVELVRSRLDGNRHRHLRALCSFFPGAENGWDVFPAFRGILNEQNGLSPGFDVSYLSCINERFRPRIVDGFLELKLGSLYFGLFYRPYHYTNGNWEQWEDIKWGYYSSADIDIPNMKGSGVYFENPWEWRRKNDWASMSSEPPKWGSIVSGLHLRAPIETVREIVTFWLTPVARIQHALKGSFDELEALLRQGPKDEHHFLGCPCIFDFGFDGSTYQVHIM